MKIVVDKVPEKPEDCVFSTCGFSGYYCELTYGYLCSIHNSGKCHNLIGVDKLFTREMINGPAYADPCYVEHPVMIKED